MLKMGQNWGKIANYPPNAQHKSAPLVTDCHIDRITRSEEQKFHLYQAVTELKSRMKKKGEKKGLSKKLIKQRNYLF